MAILIEVKKVIIGEKNGNNKRSVKYDTELIRADKIESARNYTKNDKEVDPIKGDVSIVIMESLSSNKGGERGVYKVHVNESLSSLKSRLKDAGLTVLELAG